MTGSGPFDPLNKMNLGRSVADAMLQTDARPLPPPDSLVGAGVYAIYYTGQVLPFPAYTPIAELNQNGSFNQPIYVGKAIPKGGRKGGLQLDASIGTTLRDRLRVHSSSIREAQNLDIRDFWFRSLVVDDIWIPLGENMLIEQFRPIWNLVIDGFGNKTPGVNRPQKISAWDVLHPGRGFTKNLLPSHVSVDVFFRRLDLYFINNAIPDLPLEDTRDDG